jgi:hypothetical protein
MLQSTDEEKNQNLTTASIQISKASSDARSGLVWQERQFSSNVPAERARTRTRVPCRCQCQCQQRVRTHRTVERVGLENHVLIGIPGFGSLSIHDPGQPRTRASGGALFFRTGSCGEEAWGRTSEPGRRTWPSARATPAPGLYIPPHLPTLPHQHHPLLSPSSPLLAGYSGN